MNLRDVQREFRDVHVHAIDAPVLPSRSSMDDEKMAELVASIAQLGLQQPMIVARVGERYEIIAGHRRRVACERAGLVTAPCIVYPSKVDALSAVQFSENYHREDLNAADEAIWFSELLEQQCGGDVDVLCANLHVTRNYAEGRLLLFQGDPEVFAALQRGDIKIGHAHELNHVDNESYRRMLLGQLLTSSATVTTVRGWVQQWEQSHKHVMGDALSRRGEPSVAPMPEESFFRCGCCGETTDAHVMRPVMIHDYCKRAIFDKLIAAYRGDDTTADPTTDPRRI